MPSSFERAPTSVPQRSRQPAAARETAAAVSRVLQASSYRSLREIACDYHEGVVTLRGRVGSFYLKQMAQAIAARVAGVDEVSNHIQVVVPGGARSEAELRGETAPDDSRPSEPVRFDARRSTCELDSLASGRSSHTEVISCWS